MSERERVAELAKRRGFFFPASEAYGGVAGFSTYGPQGATLKRNLEAAWRDRFVTREGNMEIEATDIMPEPVFEASGHLDTFDDMIVYCPDCGGGHRADHLVEDHTDVAEAESLPTEEIATLIAEHDIRCPDCGADLAGEPVEDFNLMFETNIGPGDADPGYLRPETAQGIFVEFPRLAEYARGQLPFGVAQIGGGWRNEISPRGGLLRLRELHMAELEYFIDPERHEPPLEAVADVELRLYPVERQDDDSEEYLVRTVGAAVEEGLLGAWIAYYLGVGTRWYERIGVDMDRFRYRQHLAGERAHYAADCWDAEAEVGGDWIEISGYAYRSDYDLGKHHAHADEDFTVFRQYDEPRTVERPTVEPDMSWLGPEYGGTAAGIADALETLAREDPDAFEADAVTVEVDGETYEIPTDRTGFAVEEETVNGEHIVPHVVEPSFGVDRLVYTVVAHNLREDTVDGEARTYLTLPPELAPTTVGVFPLMARDGLAERAHDIADDLRAAGLSATYDDSGSIGRRYRRQDEIGTPYCVTVDYDTLEDDTVTVRDRDSATQRRVPVDDLVETLAALRAGETAFETVGAPVPDA